MKQLELQKVFIQYCIVITIWGEYLHHSIYSTKNSLVLFWKTDDACLNAMLQMANPLQYPFQVCSKCNYTFLDKHNFIQMNVIETLKILWMNLFFWSDPFFIGFILLGKVMQL